VRSNPTVIDLFCGAGGLSEGFRQAGFTVLAGADVDPDACATYALNFPEAACLYGDLRDSALREQLLLYAKRATVIVGGPPCQAFSQVRNHSRLIEDPRNSLYREFAEVICSASPKAFVMENVLGMDQMGIRDQVLEDLAFGGEYSVDCRVLDAADFGVPQTRRRMLFVGVRRGAGSRAELPPGTGATSSLALKRHGEGRVRYAVTLATSASRTLKERALDPEDDSIVTVEKAISDLRLLKVGRRDDTISTSDLPSPESSYQREMRAGLNGTLRNVSVPRLNRDTYLRLQEVPPGGNHLDLSGRMKQRYITGQRWGPESGSGRLARRHYYAYRRLHPQLWSWTLNTKADSVYHYRDARALSVREFARIQSFPDCFVFTTDPRAGPIPGRIDGGPAHSRYRQVGNAVPPKLARVVALALSDAVNLRSGARNRVTA
jgi:DNA (cytosine-5)-methyltransferase 1